MTLFESAIQGDFDPIYKHLATLEEYRGKVSERCLNKKISDREKICDLWLKHQDKLDGNKSKEEIKKHFESVYWELLLCEFLTGTGFNFNSREVKGPDFRCVHPTVNNNLFCFEATSVKSGEGKNDAQIKTDILMKNEEIPIHNWSPNPLKLRITQGVQEKSTQFKKYLKESIISDRDYLIIAIHYPHEIGFLDAPSGLSVFHESVFPVGPREFTFDVKTRKVIEESNVYSPTITKHNGIKISAEFFLSEDSSHISGLLFSNVTYTNENTASLFGIIHNPMANNPMPKGLFKETEYKEWEATKCDNGDWKIDSI